MVSKILFWHLYRNLPIGLKSKHFKIICMCIIKVLVTRIYFYIVIVMEISIQVKKTAFF